MSLAMCLDYLITKTECYDRTRLIFRGTTGTNLGNEEITVARAGAQTILSAS